MGQIRLIKLLLAFTRRGIRVLRWNQKQELKRKPQTNRAKQSEACVFTWPCSSLAKRWNLILPFDVALFLNRNNTLFLGSRAQRNRVISSISFAWLRVRTHCFSGGLRVLVSKPPARPGYVLHRSFSSLCLPLVRQKRQETANITGLEGKGEPTLTQSHAAEQPEEGGDIHIHSLRTKQRARAGAQLIKS